MFLKFKKMYLNKYDYLADQTYASFSFQSSGPCGSIKKIVNYQQAFYFPDGKPVINLAFGDWNEVCKKVDDVAISNNRDRDKIWQRLHLRSSPIQMFTVKYRSMQKGIRLLKQDCTRWASMRIFLK